MSKGFKDTGRLLLAAPALTVVTAFFLVPFARSFLHSFVKNGRLGLDNYALAAKLYLSDIGFTFLVSSAGLAISLLAGVAVGGYVRVYGGRAVEFLFKVPLFVPFVVVGHAMRVFLAPHGLLNSALSAVGLLDMNRPPSIAYTWPGISVALAWKNLALAVLLVLGAFRQVRESYLEAARGHGARWPRQVWDVLLPMSRGSLSVAAVLTFTSMLGSFSIPLMIGSGRGAQMVMIDVYYRIVFHGDYGTANALGVISYLMASGAAVYYLKMVGKE